MRAALVVDSETVEFDPEEEDAPVNERLQSKEAL